MDEMRLEVSRVKKEVGQTEAEPNEITEVDERRADWKVTKAKLNSTFLLTYVSRNRREAELNEQGIMLNEKEAVRKK